MNTDYLKNDEMTFSNNVKSKLPLLCGEAPERYFVFSNGTKTKTFYDCGKFVDDDTSLAGFYPIMDKDGNVVEYLSLLGTFYVKPTAVGNAFYNYLKKEPNGPYYKENTGIGYNYKMYHNYLKNLSFKLFANKRFCEAVAEEEKRRMEEFNKKDYFANDISYLTFKNNINIIIQKKKRQYLDYKKIEQFKKDMENITDEKEKREALTTLRLKEQFYNQQYNNLNL